MISVDVDTGCKVKLFASKVVTKTYAVSISVVEFTDKQGNDNDPVMFSIKLLGKDDNGMKLYK